MRGRLKDGGVNVVLKGRIARYLQACGYTPEAAAKEAAKYSRHSGRVGMYTAASEAGVCHKRRGGTRSPQVAQRGAEVRSQCGPAKARALEEQRR